jgi:hypothetical protein
MSAADCMAKLGDKKTALEGIQAFETLFVAADAKARISMYSFVPQLMEACGSKEKPVAQSARALAAKMYAETAAWSGGYVLPFLKDSLSAKVKPEVIVTSLLLLPDSIQRAWPWRLNGVSTHYPS